LVTAIQQSLITAADNLVTAHNGSGYGRALSGKSGNYYWGSNGSVARTCMLLQLANRLAPKADYLDTCADQLAWIFGRNYYNRSQVTGVGANPPMNPHHRPSKADGIEQPWPGLLVGGGNNTSTQAAGNKNGATNWIDDVNDYELNEVAINWNAPLVYALASFLGASSGTTPGADAAVPSDGPGKTGDAAAPSDAAGQAGPDTGPLKADASAVTDDARSGAPDGPTAKSDGPTASQPDAGPDVPSATTDAAAQSDAAAKADDAPASQSKSSSGCNCSFGGTRAPSGLAIILLLGALALSRRKRL
jgi:MYXO-CTERM domain-containing protein